MPLLPFARFDCTNCVCLHCTFAGTIIRVTQHDAVFTWPNMTLCVRAALRESRRCFRFRCAPRNRTAVCNARQRPDQSDKFHLCRLKHWLLAENIYAFSFSSQIARLLFSPFHVSAWRWRRNRCTAWHGVKATRTAAGSATNTKRWELFLLILLSMRRQRRRTWCAEHSSRSANSLWPRPSYRRYKWESRFVAQRAQREL